MMEFLSRVQISESDVKGFLVQIIWESLHSDLNAEGSLFSNYESFCDGICHPSLILPTILMEVSNIKVVKSKTHKPNLDLFIFGSKKHHVNRCLAQRELRKSSNDSA
jgi:hypothetical protein